MRMNELFVTASLLACISPAVAQTAPDAAAPAEEEIVVTGFRGSVAQSIEATRDLSASDEDRVVPARRSKPTPKKKAQASKAAAAR